jgi:hypothetical protein
MPDQARQIDATVAADLLRSCHTRRLDREGIPMVLSLVDERGATAASADARTRRDGEHLAELLGAYAEVLTPGTVFRPDDEGALITVLQVLAYAHLAAPADTVDQRPGEP